MTDDYGATYSYNAHPFYHDAPWYDWVYVYYVIEEDGMLKERHYPSKILGFIEDSKDVNAAVQSSIQPVPWSKLEEEFIANFSLCTEVGKEEIVPMSSLIHPICIVPDYGAANKDQYMMILPKEQWGE